MVDPRLQLAVADGVARLSIDRPDKRNALGQAMWESIPLLVTRAVAREDVRLLVLASAVPGVFSAGADIAEFATCSRDPEWRGRNREAIRSAQLSLARADKPTIALIDGDCIGGGCGLALACDLRIATSASRFGITPARLGLVYPLHDTKLLVDLVGPSWAKRMLLTGMLLDAPTAARIGLVTEVAEDAEAVVAGIADAILAASPNSQRWAKATIGRILAGATDDDAQSFAQFEAAFDGPDFLEGVEAFLARRPPRFGG